MKIINRYIFLVLLLTIFLGFVSYGEIPYDRVLGADELFRHLDTNNEDLKNILKEYNTGNKESAKMQLAMYFKEAFAKRYFYDWNDFKKRFEQYQSIYPSKEANHLRRADDFGSTYNATPQWQLPFKNLKGNSVSAYEFRHLSRQHKAVDMMLAARYRNTVEENIRYFVGHAKSLNRAFNSGEYEKQKASGGNGVYEVFRAGYRVLNWMQIHQANLSSEYYSWKDQLELICTFLHLGAQLKYQSPKFRFGNHQTRGLSALAMVAIMFPEIKGTNLWYEHAMNLLGEHLEKEINSDGFQFERSVHYHMSDIDNYFYVYQLAQKNQFQVSDKWSSKLFMLFETLCKIAYPDGTAPVLQDDTDDPWAEYNEIGETMALGAILFDDPLFRAYSTDRVEPFKYWFVSDESLLNLKSGKREKQYYGSMAFEETGYYIMRNGHDRDALYMIIDCGLEKDKPSHQHAGILGLEAYAYGNVILPNYQVRYVLPDFQYFKSSFVKNLALMDSIAQGENWRPNSGGSGYGQWTRHAEPEAIAWSSDNALDFFAGEHNYYLSEGTSYQRSIIFIKDGFWIVQDNFNSTAPHSYQQVWQGHYDQEMDGRWIRTTFPDGGGLDIVQLHDEPYSIDFGSKRSKGNAVFSTDLQSDMKFTSLVYPFKGFDQRILETSDLENFNVKGWSIVTNKNAGSGEISVGTDANIVLNKDDQYLLIDATFFQLNDERIEFSNKTDFFIEKSESGTALKLFGVRSIQVLENNLINNIYANEKLDPGFVSKPH